MIYAFHKKFVYARSFFITIIPMELESSDDENRIYTYKAKINLINGGNYGYTFRVMPKHEMILEAANLDLVKWITK